MSFRESELNKEIISASEHNPNLKKIETRFLAYGVLLYDSQKNTWSFFQGVLIDLLTATGAVGGSCWLRFSNKLVSSASLPSSHGFQVSENRSQKSDLLSQRVVNVAVRIAIAKIVFHAVSLAS